MSPAEKRPAYEALVAKRKGCRACAGVLENTATLDGGAHDSNEIGAYTQWQRALDAGVLVVAQDFADVESFRGCGGWPDKALRTNRRLVRFAAEAGLAMRLPEPGVPDHAAFFTNAVLCLKRGSISEPVPQRCFDACGPRFLRPTIEIVRPRVVVALGLHALNAILAAFGLPTERRIGDAVAPGRRWALAAGVRAIATPHPSRGANAVHTAQWRAVGAMLASGRPRRAR